MYLILNWQFYVLIALFIIWRISRRFQLISHIEQRRVFITGCDGGFGNLLAKHLDKRGVIVYAGCLFEKSMQELEKNCSSRLKPVMIDVTKSDSVKKAADKVKEYLGNSALWGLVNNAGVGGEVGPIEFHTRESFQDVLDVNLLGVIDVTISFVPLIKRGREGRIVNISSVYGRVSHICGGYPISKYGVEAFSDMLSITLSPFNITIHTLNPGFFNTGIVNFKFVENSFRKLWNRGSQELKEEYGHDYPQKSLERAKEFLEKTTCTDVTKVVRAYADALLSKYPKNRYTVGTDAKFIFIPMSWLPFTWQIKVLQILNQLSGVAPEPRPKMA